jgi:hypothetical protein
MTTEQLHHIIGANYEKAKYIMTILVDNSVYLKAPRQLFKFLDSVELLEVVDRRLSSQPQDASYGSNIMPGGADSPTSFVGRELNYIVVDIFYVPYECIQGIQMNVPEAEYNAVVESAHSK